MTKKLRLNLPFWSAGADLLHISLHEPNDTHSGQQPVWEPGLLPAFRLLMVVPLAIGSVATVVNVVLHIVAISPDFVVPVPRSAVLIFLFFQALTLLYLCMPQLQLRLGRAYLPVALSLASIGELIIYASVILDTYSPRAMQELVAKGGGSLYFLIIPLIFITWQYGYRPAVRYTVALALFEVTAIGISIWHGNLTSWLQLQYVLQRTGIFLVIVYLVTRVLVSQRKQREALYEANQQLRQYNETLEQLTISRERNRLARELHDTLAHHMSGMILQLEGTKLLWDQDLTQAKKTLEKSLATARSGLVETRRALQALRASPLEDLGLHEAVRLLAMTTAERAGLQLALLLPPTARQPSAKLGTIVEQAIYRIVQEALTNVERHAQATHVTVQLQNLPEHIRVTIADDGCGFDATRLADWLASNDSYGLRGMHERAAAVGGELAIQSYPARGTTVIFQSGGL